MSYEDNYKVNGINKEKWFKFFLIFSPVIFAVPVALFVPLDILNYSNIKAFVSFMEGVAPSIYRVNSSIDIWQVSKLFYSVAWACVPFSAICVMYRGIQNKEQLLKVRRERGHTPVVRSLILLFAGFLFYGLWSYGLTDSSRAIEWFATYTRFGMVTIGIAFILLAASLLGVILVYMIIFNEE